MYRKLTTGVDAVEVRLFAADEPGQEPLIETLAIPAGEVVQFSADEVQSAYVRVRWRGRLWMIDQADWDRAQRIAS